MYYLNLLFFITALGLFLLLYWSIKAWLQSKKLQQILSQPFPQKYENILNTLTYYQKLSTQEKNKIKKSILIFIESKKFIGVKLEITDEIRVTVAFYACLLLLNIPTKNCYDNLLTIIVYPSHVIYDAARENGGIVSKEPLLLEGQSANDTVVISWNDAKKEAYHIGKDNVILHEFAHEIDFLDGEIDGIPPLDESKYAQWSEVVYNDYNKLKAKAIANRYWGKYKILGNYAATNEAEFFAVATERFLGTPTALKHHFPDLYNELKDFYKIDPANKF